MELTKEDLLKVWDASIMSMTADVPHEIADTPSMASYSIQLPSFTQEPILCNIQLLKISSQAPRLSVIVGSYIELCSAELSDSEFTRLSQQFMDKNDMIELEIRNRLLKRAEKNLEILIESI